MERVWQLPLEDEKAVGSRSVFFPLWRRSNARTKKTTQSEPSRIKINPEINMLYYITILYEGRLHVCNEKSLTCVRCCWRRLGSHSTIRPLCGNADAAQLRLDAHTRCCQNKLESSLRGNRAQPPRGPPPKHGLLSRSRSGQKKEI